MDKKDDKHDRFRLESSDYVVIRNEPITQEQQDEANRILEHLKKS